MTNSIQNYGERLDLKIRQGATFGPVTATMTNPDGTAVNLTGCTIRGQIRQKALDTVIVATFDCTITNPTGGVYTFGLTSTVTAGISAAEKIDSAGSKYVWDLELVDASGRVTALYYGEVTVLREVTR